VLQFRELMLKLVNCFECTQVAECSPVPSMLSEMKNPSSWRLKSALSHSECWTKKSWGSVALLAPNSEDWLHCNLPNKAECIWKLSRWLNFDTTKFTYSLSLQKIIWI
jgi:hypothetical protein